MQVARIQEMTTKDKLSYQIVFNQIPPNSVKNLMENSEENMDCDFEA